MLVWFAGSSLDLPAALKTPELDYDPGQIDLSHPSQTNTQSRTHRVFSLLFGLNCVCLSWTFLYLCILGE